MEYENSIDIFAVQEVADGAPEISRLTLQISPIPSELVNELHLHLADAVKNFFVDKGLSSGRMAQEPAPGGMLQ